MRLIFLCAFAAVLLGGTVRAQDSSGRIVPWPAFVQNFLDGYFRFRPDLAVTAGRHEFDGRLPDWSPQGIAMMVHFLKEQRAAAGRFNALNRTHEFERVHLISQIDSDLFWIEDAQLPYTNPTCESSFEGMETRSFSMMNCLSPNN